MGKRKRGDHDTGGPKPDASRDYEMAIVSAEYDSDALSEKGYEDLLRWIDQRNKTGVAVWRLAMGGSARVVVAVCWKHTGLWDALASRLKCTGGRMTTLPEETNEALIKRFLAGAEQGIVGERRNIVQPLRPPSDAGLN